MTLPEGLVLAVAAGVLWKFIQACRQIRIDEVSPETARRLRMELARDHDMATPRPRRRENVKGRGRLIAFSRKGRG